MKQRFFLGLDLAESVVADEVDASDPEAEDQNKRVRNIFRLRTLILRDTA